MRGFDPGDGFGVRGHVAAQGFDRMGRPGWMQLFRRVQRALPRHHPGHQDLAALMVEVAIGEAHAGYRAAKTALILLVEVEAWIERQPLDRSSERLAMHLQRV